jgi:serine protease Do
VSNPGRVEATPRAGRFEHFEGDDVHPHERFAARKEQWSNPGGPHDLNMKTEMLSGLNKAVALGVLGAACVGGLPLYAKDAPKLSVSDRDIDRASRGTSYAPVIKRVTPAVVTIESTRTVPVRQFRHPFMDDPMFRRFFGEGDDSGQPSRKMGLGSGVIVTEDGYILTNNHVVDGADEDGIKVAMPDGKTRYDAKVVGKDPRTDVAVLKIEAPKKLPAITMADSDKVEVGDVVLAVGNPFAVGQSVTMGIVSALGRSYGILGRQGYEDFIQTDAAINQGNSGGALVDAEGRLIGINQSIWTPSGGNAGIGFAIPVNLARSVLERLIADGKIVRGYLGVSLQPLTLELAESFKLSDSTGALVNGVQSDTPAAKAGMEDGDVIIEFNGKKVSDSAHLRLMVSQTPPKTTVTFKVLRDGKEKEFRVTLAELPDDLAGGPDGKSSDDPADSGVDALDGVEVTDLDNRSRRQFEIPQRVRGALVTKVDPDSNAAEAGLRPGHVIVEINRQPVRSADDAVDLTKNVKGGRLLLRVYSNAGGASGTHYLTVEVGKKKK